MLILITAILGVAFLGTEFFKTNIFGISLMSVYIIITFLYYGFTLLYILKNETKITQIGKNFLIFTVYGFIIVVLSYLGFFERFTLQTVLVNYSYIPRQSYYLYFLPLIVCIPIHKCSKTIINFITDHAYTLGIILYVCYVTLNQTFALNPIITFILTFLLLLDGKKILSRYLLLAIIIFSPIGVGGEMAQVIMRFLLVLFYTLYDHHKQISIIIFVTLLLAMIATLFSNLIIKLPIVEILDANSKWRLDYWASEINTVLSTYGLGVGYGTSYAGFDFLWNVATPNEGPFRQTEFYTFEERAFVVGSHNSIVTVFFRTGLIGLLLFLKCLLNSYYDIMKKNGHRAIVYCYFGAIILVLFNVGLESPMYLFIFIFAMSLSQLIIFNKTELATKKNNLIN